MTVDTDSGLCTASGVSLGASSETRLICSVTAANDSSEPYDLGTTTVVWTATDGSGNTSTCTQVVYSGG